MNYYYHKCIVKEYKYSKKTIYIIRYIMDALNVSSDYSDESDEK